MSIESEIQRLRAALPEGVSLVAVSKTHPAEAIMEAYRAGQRIFGENRPQEMKAKYDVLPKDIEWHLIGHLQTNKVKLIVPFVAMIHSVDSDRLLREIDRQAERCGRTIDVLLEVKIGLEESKEGWDSAALIAWLEEGSYRTLQHVRFRGVMGVATNTVDREEIRREFESLSRLRGELQSRFFDEGFDRLSMGMTSDWELAVAAGSNMVRIGSLIFGARDYNKHP